MNSRDLARYFDHTALKAETTPEQIEQLCQEAKTHGFAAVCVNPVYVALAARQLRGTECATCTVVGFPLGATTTGDKISEAEDAITAGATEIDMVIWVGGLKARRLSEVETDIRAVAETCHRRRASLKVIIECALLTDDEKRIACELAVTAGTDYVKTSTGFAATGATVADVQLMSAIARARGVGVKAAGGIRTLADAQAMLDAGATRIGASASVAILREAQRQEQA